MNFKPEEQKNDLLSMKFQICELCSSVFNDGINLKPGNKATTE